MNMSTIDYEIICGTDYTSNNYISKDDHTSFAASIDLQTKVEPKTYSMAVCNVNQFSDNNSPKQDSSYQYLYSGSTAIKVQKLLRVQLIQFKSLQSNKMIPQKTSNFQDHNCYGTK